MSFRAGRLACVPILLALAALPAPAYYHFIHYLNGVAVPEKFNLAALPNNTVTFLVSESGPKTYQNNDNFNSVLTEIRQAVLVWNGIAQSNLRVSFGGLENSATLQNSAGGDVIFEDLPPGVEGYGGPTSSASPVTAADGSQYMPILRSVVHLNLNMTVVPGPSYTAAFFMTTVHELGHALGLQHTFTSATMSQATTRATTLTHPLAADDVAGISVLYPGPAFARFGSIAGRITAGGQPVHLASVVAMPSWGDALSAVTNPDGTFRIDGVPPGSYYVYVHSMPPDADIFGPWNPDGTVAAATGPVNTLFHGGTTNGGTTNFLKSAVVPVQAGVTAAGIDIDTTMRADLPLYDGQIYGYFNAGAQSIAVTPANVDMIATPTTVAASIVTAANGLAPGLDAQAVGGSILVGAVRPYAANGYTYYALDLRFSLFVQPGLQHMVFDTPDYTYVLPSAINLTLGPPPTVTAVHPNGDGTLTITGTNWASDTLLYFDGLPSSIVSLDADAASAVVVPPPGFNNQQAILTAYNSDGQNSQFLQSASPVTYSYAGSNAPSIASIAPSSLPAGAEASIDITGSGFAFTPGLTTVGFGTSDIVAQRVFVLSPNHLRVDVYVSPNAALSNPDVTVMAGFQLATATAGFQIVSPVSGVPTPVFPILSNALPGLTGAYPGAAVRISGANLTAASGVPAVTIGGQSIPLLNSSPSQINLLLPSTLTPGPATLTLSNGVTAAYPLAVNIDPLPAAIVEIQNDDGAFIDGANPAAQGDTLVVTLGNFAPPGTAVDPSRVQVSIGGVYHSATQINTVESDFQVYFTLTSSDPVGKSEPLIVYLDGISSYPAAIPVTDADGSFAVSGTP